MISLHYSNHSSLSWNNCNIHILTLMLKFWLYSLNVALILSRRWDQGKHSNYTQWFSLLYLLYIFRVVTPKSGFVSLCDLIIKSLIFSDDVVGKASVASKTQWKKSLYLQVCFYSQKWLNLEVWVKCSFIH